VQSMRIRMASEDHASHKVPELSEQEVEQEIWAKIEEFPRYSISSMGRVKNSRTGRLIRIRDPHKDTEGYCVVRLRVRPRRIKGRRIHRLMALAFIPNDDPIGKPLVDHIDRNRTNNALSNLRWVSYITNARNSGRSKSSSEKLKHLGIRLPMKVIVRLEARARYRGMPTSQFIRNVLTAASERR